MVQGGGDGLDRRRWPAAVREGGFHLVLLDVVLPGMDGLTVCAAAEGGPVDGGRAALHADRATTRRADLEAALAAGANGYIHKPFRGSELMELVERLRTAAA
jgi:CheY-like chemotaxis protein